MMLEDEDIRLLIRSYFLKPHTTGLPAKILSLELTVFQYGSAMRRQVNCM